MSQLENLEEMMSKFEGTSRGFLTQNCVTWVGNYKGQSKSLWTLLISFASFKCFLILFQGVFILSSMHVNKITAVAP